MRRSRLKILPSRCVATLGFILLLLACPTIAEESVRPADINERETSASHAHARIKNAPPDGLEVCQVEDKSLDRMTSPDVRTTQPFQHTAPDETRRLHDTTRNVEFRTERMKERILTRSMERKESRRTGTSRKEDTIRTTIHSDSEWRSLGSRSSLRRSVSAPLENNRMISKSRRDPIMERRNNDLNRDARTREVRSSTRRLNTIVPDSERLNLVTPIARKMTSASRQDQSNERRITELNREDISRATRRLEVRSTIRFTPERRTLALENVQRSERAPIESIRMDQSARRQENLERRIRDVSRDSTDRSVRLQTRDVRSLSAVRRSENLDSRVRTQRSVEDIRRIVSSTHRDQPTERRLNDLTRNDRRMETRSFPERRSASRNSPDRIERAVSFERREAGSSRRMQSNEHRMTDLNRESRIRVSRSLPERRTLTHDVGTSQRSERAQTDIRRMDQSARREETQERRIRDTGRDTTDRSVRLQTRDDRSLSTVRRSENRGSRERTQRSVEDIRRVVSSSRGDQSAERRFNDLSRSDRRTETRFLSERRSPAREAVERIERAAAFERRESRIRISRSSPERLALARDTSRRFERSPTDIRMVDPSARTEESLERRIRDVSRDTTDRSVRLQTRDARSLSAVRRSENRDNRERTQRSEEDIRRVVSSSRRDKSAERRLNDLSQSDRRFETRSFFERRSTGRDTLLRTERALAAERRNTAGARRVLSNDQRIMDLNRESRIRVSRSLPESLAMPHDNSRRSERASRDIQRADPSGHREENLARRIKEVSRDTTERSARLQTRDARSLSAVRRSENRDSRERIERSAEDIRRVVSSSRRDQSTERRLNDLNRNYRRIETRSFSDRRSTERVSLVRTERAAAYERREAGSLRRIQSNEQRIMGLNRESRIRLSRSLPETRAWTNGIGSSRRSERAPTDILRMDRSARREEPLERRIRDVSRDTTDRSARRQSSEARSLSAVRRSENLDSREQNQRSVDGIRRLVSLSSRDQSAERRLNDLNRTVRRMETKSLSERRTADRDSLDRFEGGISAERREITSSRRIQSNEQRIMGLNRESRIRVSRSLPERLALAHDNTRRSERTTSDIRRIDQSDRREENLERRIRDFSRDTTDRYVRQQIRDARTLSAVRRSENRDSRERTQRSVDDIRRVVSSSRRDQSRERRSSDVSRDDRRLETRSLSERRSVDRDSVEGIERSIVAERRVIESSRRTQSNEQRTMGLNREFRIMVSRSLPERLTLAHDISRRSVRGSTDIRRMDLSARREQNLERRLRDVSRDTNERSVRLQTRDARILSAVRRSENRDSRDRNERSVEDIRRVVSSSRRDQSTERRLNDLSRKDRRIETRSFSESRGNGRDCFERIERVLAAERREAGSSRRIQSNEQRTIGVNRESRTRVSRSMPERLTLAHDNSRRSERATTDISRMDESARRGESLERRIRDVRRDTTDRSVRQQIRDARTLSAVRLSENRDSMERNQRSVEDIRRFVSLSRMDQSTERTLNGLSRNGRRIETRSFSERRSTGRDSLVRTERALAAERRDTASTRRELSNDQRIMGLNRESRTKVSRSLPERLAFTRDKSRRSERASTDIRRMDLSARREENLERRIRNTGRDTTERSVRFQTREARSLSLVRGSENRDSWERTQLSVHDIRRVVSSSRGDRSVDTRDARSLSAVRRSENHNSRERTQRSVEDISRVVSSLRRDRSTDTRDVRSLSAVRRFDSRDSRERSQRSVEDVRRVISSSRRDRSTDTRDARSLSAVRRFDSHDSRERAQRSVEDLRRVVNLSRRDRSTETRDARSLSAVRRSEIRDSRERTRRSVEDVRKMASSSRRDQSTERRLNDLSRNDRRFETRSFSERRNAGRDSLERFERAAAYERRETGLSRRIKSDEQRVVNVNRESRMRVSMSLPEGLALGHSNSRRSERAPIDIRRMDQSARREENLEQRIRDVSRLNSDISVRLQTRVARSLSTTQRTEMRERVERGVRASAARRTSSASRTEKMSTTTRRDRLTDRLKVASEQYLSERISTMRIKNYNEILSTSQQSRESRMEVRRGVKGSAERRSNSFNGYSVAKKPALETGSTRPVSETTTDLSAQLSMALDSYAESNSNAIKLFKDVTMPIEEDSAMSLYSIVIETTFKIYTALLSLVLPSKAHGIQSFFEDGKLNLFANVDDHFNSDETSGKLSERDHGSHLFGNYGDIPEQLLPQKVTTRQKMLSATIGGCIAALSMSTSTK